MRVRMRVHISGTHDGLDWPPPGDEVDLSDDEALSLIRIGLAAPLEPAAERATIAPRAERAVIRRKKGTA